MKPKTGFASRSLDFVQQMAFGAILGVVAGYAGVRLLNRLLTTLLVVAVWVRDEGVELLQRWFPDVCRRVAKHPASIAMTHGLDRIARMIA